MAIALLLAATAIQAPSAGPPPVAMQALPRETLFVLSYAQGPRWVAGLPMAKQNLLAHLRYMQQLLRDGVLVGGGPVVGENAGIALIRATDLVAAQAVLANDPAIRNGVFVATVRAWDVRVGAPRPPAG